MKRAVLGIAAVMAAVGVLCVRTSALADFRVFTNGADAGIARDISCTGGCYRSGSTLVIVGDGGSGQWIDTVGGIYYGSGSFVGINDSTPSVALDVTGSAAISGNLTVDAGVSVANNTLVGGRVGIQDPSPSFPLSINQALAVAGRDDCFASFSDTTADGGFLRFCEGTGQSNQFVPSIFGKALGSGATRVGLGVNGEPGANNSTSPAVMIAGTFNGGALVGSPIAGFQNNGTMLSTITSSGGFSGPTGDFTGAVTVGGNFSVDTSSFFVDGTTANRVAIGHASPGVPLDILNNGAGASIMKVRNSSTTGFSAITLFDSGNTQRLSMGFGNSGVSAPYASSNYLYLGGSTLKFINNSSVSLVELTNAGVFSTLAGTILGDASGDSLTINSNTASIPNGLTLSSGSLTVDSNLLVNGNTTLGNASGDVFTINAATGSFPNGVVITAGGSTIGVDVTATGSATIGIRGTGNGSSVGVRGVGGASGAGGSFAGGATSGQGIVATGSPGSSSAGVLATGGGTNGDGVGGTGGGTSGVGVRGTGAGTSGTGVHGQGGGTGAGIRGIGGATGVGGLFNGGATSGIGVQGTGSSTSAGVRGIGGSGGGRGGEFVGDGNGDGLSASVASGSTGKAVNMDATNGTGYAFYAIADQSSPVSAVGRFATQDADPSVAVNGDIYVYSGNESFRFYTRGAWREFQVLGKDSTDNSGTPGNTTINKPNGRFAVDAAATSVTVTNSYVAAASIVMVTKMDNDATCTDFKVVPGSGSFVVTCNAAATAAVKFMFSVE